MGSIAEKITRMVAQERCYGKEITGIRINSETLKSLENEFLGLLFKEEDLQTPCNKFQGIPIFLGNNKDIEFLYGKRNAETR